MAPTIPPRPVKPPPRPRRQRRRGAGISAHIDRIALHWSTEDSFQIERVTGRTRRFGLLLAYRSRG